MNISIVASGTRGDVQPYVALGKGFQAAGYPVRVLTTDDFEGLIQGAGLEFYSIGTSIEATLQSEEWKKTAESSNFLKIVSRMQQEMKSRAHDMALKMLSLLAGSDLILAGMSGMTGAFSVAEKMGIPLLQAYVFPITPTRTFASPLTPSLPFGGTLNRLSFHVMRQILWQSGRAGDVTTRQELKMKPVSFWGPYRSLEQQPLPVLYGYSPHVLARPADWQAKIQLTGYWFLDADDDWMPDPKLVDFLQAGPPPVYIGFGSMGSRNPEEASQLALKALALSGQRGLLASGWGGLSPADLPSNVHMIASSPHSWLFPQMAAVVHHGGAGTTAAGLRSGVPSIVVPFMGDQAFWGQRVAQLGVGPAPVPRRRLTAEQLAARITQAVSDTSMRQRAAELGAKIRAEDGVGQAVKLIQSLSKAG